MGGACFSADAAAEAVLKQTPPPQQHQTYRILGRRRACCYLNWKAPCPAGREVQLAELNVIVANPLIAVFVPQ